MIYLRFASERRESLLSIAESYFSVEITHRESLQHIADLYVSDNNFSIICESRYVLQPANEFDSGGAGLVTTSNVGIQHNAPTFETSNV